MKTAWVFPGQGSQKVGMADFALSFSGGEERFKLVSELIGRDLLEICQGKADPNSLGELSDLNDTRNTQPGLFLVESLLVDDLFDKGLSPSLVAGHSLGEIVALYAAKVFDLETALRLIILRSELMAAAGGGAMTALLGFDRSELEDLVNNIEGVVIANDNSEGQVVLSGSQESVDKVTSRLTCKRSVPLQVSGAFHSPYMTEPARKFADQLDKVCFNKPHTPILHNSEPSPTTDIEIIRNRLKKQMISGVRWRETMMEISSQGIQKVIEIGPGNVLSGLIKRSIKGIAIEQVSGNNMNS